MPGVCRVEAAGVVRCAIVASEQGIDERCDLTRLLAIGAGSLAIGNAGPTYIHLPSASAVA